MRTITQSMTLTGTAYGTAIHLNGAAITAIQAPAALTSTALNVKGSVDGVTFGTLLVNGSAYTVTIAQGQVAAINPIIFAGVPYVQFAPGTDESTNQRVFTLAISEV